MSPKKSISFPLPFDILLLLSKYLDIQSYQELAQISPFLPKIPKFYYRAFKESTAISPSPGKYTLDFCRNPLDQEIYILAKHGFDDCFRRILTRTTLDLDQIDLILGLATDGLFYRDSITFAISGDVIVPMPVIKYHPGIVYQTTEKLLGFKDDIDKYLIRLFTIAVFQNDVELAKLVFERTKKIDVGFLVSMFVVAIATHLSEISLVIFKIYDDLPGLFPQELIIVVAEAGMDMVLKEMIQKGFDPTLGILGF